MFKQARLKLTAWYLVIIMFISLSFSLVIFRFLCLEVDRFANMQRFRFERRFLENGISPPLIIVDSQLVADTKSRVALVLALINGGILFISGGLGFLLAGKTLKPIQQMLDDQKRFVSDASHELRTPLTSLKSAIEVGLRDKKLTLKDAKILLKENIADVDRLQLLTQGLLKLTNSAAVDSAIKFSQTSAEAIVNEVIKRTKSIATSKNITILNQVKDIRISADPSGLADVLVILIDNAIKYSQDSTRITISSRQHDAYLYLSVTDQGVGINSFDLPRIFDRFYRADQSRSASSPPGYGLGLSIAQKIITAHHGAISVVSKPGQGSTFTVKLPLVQPKLS
ncbi:MAG: HAMP domain-containing sensor histidine kinase [Candidatus Shapirobacteria bacterium]|jgi:signal transduction histidine kinase